MKRGIIYMFNHSLDNVLYRIPERPDVDGHMTLYDSIAEPYVRIQ